MELDWTTVALEVINFLVLVWILKRFLYQPVLDLVERRRAGVEETLAEAAKRERSAEELRRQFEGRLQQWRQEKEAAQEQLQRELAQDRSSAEKALKAGAKFATRLLGDLSDPGLEKRIVDLVCAELAALPEEQRESLRHRASDSIVVHSAYPLDEEQRVQLCEALGAVLARRVAPDFAQEPELLAGVRIVMGDWTLGANLRDELTFFAERALHES